MPSLEMYTPRILIVEDDKEQCDLVAQAIVSRGPEWKLEFSSTGKDTLERLQKEHFDAILLDHQLPDMSGLSVLSEITARNIDVAVVFNAPFGNEQMAAEAMQAGATDYVQKSDVMYTHLASVLRSCIQIQQIKRAMRLTHQAEVQTQRHEALLQLSLSLRHEINNPLAALCGYVELLMAQVKDDPELNKRVKQIYDEAMRISDVVRRTENIKDELQEYLPGLQMIRLRDPVEPVSPKDRELPKQKETKPSR